MRLPGGRLQPPAPFRASARTPRRAPPARPGPGSRGACRGRAAARTRPSRRTAASCPIPPRGPPGLPSAPGCPAAGPAILLRDSARPRFRFSALPARDTDQRPAAAGEGPPPPAAALRGTPGARFRAASADAPSRHAADRFPRGSGLRRARRTAPGCALPRAARSRFPPFPGRRATAPLPGTRRRGARPRRGGPGARREGEACACRRADWPARNIFCRALRGRAMAATDRGKGARRGAGPKDAGSRARPAAAIPGRGTRGIGGDGTGIRPGGGGSGRRDGPARGRRGAAASALPGIEPAPGRGASRPIPRPDRGGI